MIQKVLFVAFMQLAIRSVAYTQTDLAEIQKIATFTKVWGFLKYYHPKVATGKHDWDQEFMTRIKDLPSLKNKEEISRYYLDWLNSLGPVRACAICHNTKDTLTFNLNLEWMKDSTQFTGKLMDMLEYIRQNRNQGKNYYVQYFPFVGNTSYKNEKPYKGAVYPGAEMRLLGLARYWNIIEYFYPYKYRIGEVWNQVLTEMIPAFKDAPDTIAYHLAMRELTVKLNDSHAGFVTDYTYLHFGNKWAPFKFKLIDNKAVVTGFYNDSLCTKNDIRHGDVFLTVNHKSIGDIIKEQWKYVSASNDATKLSHLWYGIFNGATDSVEVTYERNGEVNTKELYRYTYTMESMYPKFQKLDKKDICKILDGNIGYVNMAGLVPGQVRAILRKVKGTRAIIFDVRNYPYGAMYKIASFLNPEKKTFAIATVPDINYPGMYKYSNESLTCGHKNKKAYKGKVVLLFNEKTISHAEFTLMALQTAPNVMSIGSTTAGADGDVSDFTFPGGYSTTFTGLGIYYPDKRETQRVGIIPDIVVHPTIEGIRSNRDEVLEKALEVLGKN